MSGGWKKASFEKLAPREIIGLIISPAKLAEEIGHPVTVRQTESGIVIEISGYAINEDGVVIEVEKPEAVQP